MLSRSFVLALSVTTLGSSLSGCSLWHSRFDDGPRPDAGTALSDGGRSVDGGLAADAGLPVDAGPDDPPPWEHAFVQVTASDLQSCARDSAGEVYCWGRWPTDFEEGGTDEIRAPRRVEGASGASDLASAPGYACALGAGGIVCWGQTPFTAPGETTPWAAPIEVPESNSVRGLVAHPSRVCAIAGADDHLRCWGTMRGTGSCSDEASPRPVPRDPIDHPEVARVARIRASGGVTCGIEAGRGATCVGYRFSPGDRGLEGWEGRVRSFELAGAVDMHLRHDESCFGAAEHYCLIGADGDVSCEGAFDRAPLARPDDGALVRALISTQQGHWSGGGDACYLTEAGSLFCEHEGGVSRLADRLVDVAAGQGHACSVDVGGALRCWGSNEYGALGIGVAARFAEARTVRGVEGAVQIAAGDNHTCALTRDGRVTCWGGNVLGERGFDRTSPIPATPFSIDEPALTDAPDEVSLTVAPEGLFAGGWRTCVTTAEGLTCWGNDYLGWQGLDGPTRLADVPASLSHAEVGDREESCGVDSAGAVFCWGRGYYGARRGVERVSLPGPARAVAGTISDRICALLASGEAYCWGSNVSGSLPGPGVPLAPRRAPEITDARALTAQCVLSNDDEWRCVRWPMVREGGGPEHMIGGVSATDGACAIVSGRVFCTRAYGDRGGRFPVTWTPDGPVMHEVLGITDAVALATGEAHACALRARGEVACWGWAASGRLGDGSATMFLEPRGVAPPAER